jgi:hypothetical protein
MRCSHIDYQVIPSVDFSNDEGDEFSVNVVKTCLLCGKTIDSIELNESDDRWSDIFYAIKDLD